MKNTYGILGGYGAVATLHLQQLLVKRVLSTGQYADTAFPRMIISNLPEDIINAEGHISSLGSLRTELGKTAPLFQAATDVYVICNTFHVEEEFMQRVFANKLHSVPALTSQAVADSGHSKPLIVGSKLTSKDSLYSHATYTPTNMFADELIAAGMKYQTSHPQLTDVVTVAEQAGSDCIVLGCTDLSVMADTLRTMTKLPVIDSVEAVANHIYNSHTKEES